MSQFGPRRVRAGHCCCAGSHIYGLGLPNDGVIPQPSPRTYRSLRRRALGSKHPTRLKDVRLFVGNMTALCEHFLMLILAAASQIRSHNANLASEVHLWLPKSRLVGVFVLKT